MSVGSAAFAWYDDRQAGAFEGYRLLGPSPPMGILRRIARMTGKSQDECS